MTEDLRQAEIEYIRHCMSDTSIYRDCGSFEFLLRLRDATWLVVARMSEGLLHVLVARLKRGVHQPSLAMPWDACLEATPEKIWAKIDHRRKFPLDGASTAA